VAQDHSSKENGIQPPRFLAACQRKAVDATPVWFMRQAGRYMQEYQAVRAKASLLEICQTPELAVEVTLQPLRVLGVDAAILFADILLPAIPLGVGVSFVEGKGPIIHRPIRSIKDVQALKTFNPAEELGYVYEAIHLLRGELKGIPLIGFCGAPFTLAAYLIEGATSRNFVLTKTMMYAAPETWFALLEKLTDVLIEYLTAQIRAGAQAVQVFDSWVGMLSPHDYSYFVLPFSARLLKAAESEGVPVIHFGTQNSTLLSFMKAAGGTVLGLDWRIPLDEGWQLLGEDVAVQGNLDPVVLFAPLTEIKKRVEDILRRANGRKGHIFNLGHGILPHTPVDHVKAVVEMVHEFRNE